MTTRNLKVGDRVRVMRKVEKEEGWEATWVAEMGFFLPGGIFHKEYKVRWIDRFGVTLDGRGFGWPPSALDLVEEAPYGCARSVHVPWSLAVVEKLYGAAPRSKVALPDPTPQITASNAKARSLRESNIEARRALRKLLTGGY